MNFLVDENMPRSLAPKIAELGFAVQDVRDIGLTGHPDEEVMQAAIAADAIIITGDRRFADPRSWSEEFTAVLLRFSISFRIVHLTPFWVRTLRWKSDEHCRAQYDRDSCHRPRNLHQCTILSSRMWLNIPEGYSTWKNSWESCNSSVLQDHGCRAVDRTG